MHEIFIFAQTVILEESTGGEDVGCDLSLEKQHIYWEHIYWETAHLGWLVHLWSFGSELFIQERLIYIYTTKCVQLLDLELWDKLSLTEQNQTALCSSCIKQRIIMHFLIDRHFKDWRTYISISVQMWEMVFVGFVIWVKLNYRSLGV